MFSKSSRFFKICVREVHGSKIGIVRVPFSKGNRRRGCEKGPAAIFDGSLIKSLTSFDANPNLDIVDYGEVKFGEKKLRKDEPNIPHYAEFIACIEEVSKTVKRVIEDGRLCINIGGDHSIGAGTIDGHVKAKQGNVSILYIDAHTDINTAKTSHTSHLDGMPLSMVIAELAKYWTEYPDLDFRTPIIPAKSLAFIGARSVDDYERLIIDKLGIAAFGMDAVDDLGIKEIIRRALRRIDPDGNKSIHVSIDVDAFDALEVPATAIPTRGGLSLREGILIVETVHNTGRLGAFDLCEVNPTLGDDEEVKKTVEVAIELIRAATGHKRSGRPPLNVTEIPF